MWKLQLMKTINYRGGVVTFQIPSHWIEEYGEAGGGLFYDSSQDSGTLRLSLLSFSAKEPFNQFSGKPSSRNEAVHALETLSIPEEACLISSIEALPDGTSAIVSYSTTEREDDDDLKIWFWQIAHISPPNKIDFAIFSYAALACAEDSPTIKAELAVLNENLRKCRFYK